MKTKKEIEKMKTELDKQMTKLLFKRDLTDREKIEFTRTMAQIEMICEILEVKK